MLRIPATSECVYQERWRIESRVFWVQFVGSCAVRPAQIPRASRGWPPTNSRAGNTARGRGLLRTNPPAAMHKETRSVRGYIRASSLCIVLVLLQKIARDDQPLQLIGAATDHHQRRITIIALHRKILRVAVSAQDTHRFERNLRGSFGGK